MSKIRRHLCRFLVILFIFGWASQPWWFYDWYSDWPENYAYPASLSNECDPPGGFWYW